MRNQQSIFGVQGVWIRRGASLAYIPKVDSVSIGDNVSLAPSGQSHGLTTNTFTGEQPFEMSMTCRGLSPRAIEIMTGAPLTNTAGGAHTATIHAITGDWSDAEKTLTIADIDEVGAWVLERTDNNTITTTKIHSLDKNIILSPQPIIDTGDAGFVISAFNNVDRPAGDYFSRTFINIGSTINILNPTADPDAPIEDITYQWQRSNDVANPRWADIADEDGLTYDLQAVDENKLLRVEIRYTDGEGNDEVVYTPIERIRRNTGARINPPMPEPIVFNGISGVSVSVEGLEVGDKAIIEVYPEASQRGTLNMGSACIPEDFTLLAISDPRVKDSQSAILYIPKVKIGNFPFTLTSVAESSFELSGQVSYDNEIEGYCRLTQIVRS